MFAGRHTTIVHYLWGLEQYTYAAGERTAKAGTQSSSLSIVSTIWFKVVSHSNMFGSGSISLHTCVLKRYWNWSKIAISNFVFQLHDWHSKWKQPKMWKYWKKNQDLMSCAPCIRLYTINIQWPQIWLKFGWFGKARAKYQRFMFSSFDSKPLIL